MSKRDAAPFETRTMRHGNKAGEHVDRKMYYSYGICSLHLEKAKGTDSRMSAHIERARPPQERGQNVHAPEPGIGAITEGVRNRTQAIAHRMRDSRHQTQGGHRPR